MYSLMTFFAAFLTLGFLTSFDRAVATPQPPSDPPGSVDRPGRPQPPGRCGLGRGGPFGFANLCRQCQLDSSGDPVEFENLRELARAIRIDGVAPRQAAILQGFIQSELDEVASRIRVRARCIARCAGDPRCASSSFSFFRRRRCVFVAKNYVINNKAGIILANAFQAIFNEGGRLYCLICRRDSYCFRWRGRDRRSLDDSADPIRNEQS